MTAATTPPPFRAATATSPKGHRACRTTTFSFFNLTDNIVLSFEVINLTDEAERLFTTGDGDLDLVREYNKTGASSSSARV